MVKLCFLLYHVFPPRQHSAANRSPADMGARRAKKPAAGAFCVRTPACRAGGIGEPFSAPSPVRRADPTGGASPPRACGPSTHPKGPPQNANGERPTQKCKHRNANTKRKPRKNKHGKAAAAAVRAKTERGKKTGPKRSDPASFWGRYVCVWLWDAAVFQPPLFTLWTARAERTRRNQQNGFSVS